MKSQTFIESLKSIVGSSRVLTSQTSMARYRKGFRSGEGEAEAVIIPKTLVQYWKALQRCVTADRVVIMQAANTGLTEGSTPNGSYDRPCVIVSTKDIDRLITLNGGKQVISFPGSTLYALEKLLKPLNRQPHSVIGSSCIGASIIGGVCNNSGGALVQRGPSYTEMALFARKTAQGKLELVNHLGINLGSDPIEILENLESGSIPKHKIEDTNRKASDTGYTERVRQIDAPSPARYNADKDRLFEASGCAGKVAVFAVRLDTYENPEKSQVFYIGTNSTEALTKLRRGILAQFQNLPVSGEYMHRDCFDIAHRYGKDTLMAIHYAGTDFLPSMFAAKGWVDGITTKLGKIGEGLSDRFMQGASRVWPEMLPKRILDYRDRFEHHLILKMEDGGIDETHHKLGDLVEGSDLEWFECNERETSLAMLHRFAAAGAAVRYQTIHHNEVEDILALDIALRRNDKDWFETLPPELDEQIVHKLYYGHFFCHVLHQDYIVKKGADVKALKAHMLQLLDERGAEYPAEHNVGHLYCAKPPLADFYKELDPTNSFNPGIGKQSKGRNYA